MPKEYQDFKGNWTKYFNATQIDENIKKYLDDYVKQMDVKSKIVEQIDKSMDELKKKNPNFTNYKDKWENKAKEGGDSKPQNVESLSSMSLVQRLASVSDWFGDLDEMIPDYSGALNNNDKYSKKRMEEYHRWMDFAKDKVLGQFQVRFDTQKN
jgi:hypothetical protein